MKLQLFVTYTDDQGDSTVTCKNVKDFYIVCEPDVVDPPWWSEVVAELSGGLLVNAIKAYRAHTGLGLKESKAAVEAVRDQLIKDGTIKRDARLHV